MKETCIETKLERTYSVKEFLSTSAKKKLELPVQKNVLTNYFCLASIEAKRKFRAPKVMPKRMLTTESSPSSSSLESDSPGSAEEATYVINHNEGSLLLSGDLGGNLSPKTEGALSSRSNNTMDLPSRENIVSSPQPSQLESEHKSLHPSFTLHNKYGYISELDANEYGSCGMDAAEGNINLSTRKIPTKSSYFFHTSCENDNHNQNQEDFVHEEDRGVLGNSQVSKAASSRHSYPKSAIKKRKLDSYEETIPVNNVNTISVVEEGNNSISKLNNNCIDAKAEGKFGCNISHVKSYSGIAEKSMDRFASLISSFKYNSSGSRASGLRPPLKDVQNTCPIRYTCKSKNAKTV